MLRPSLSLIIRTCEAPCVLPAQQETVTEFFIRAAGHRLSIYTLSEARDIAVLLAPLECAPNSGCIISLGGRRVKRPRGVVFVLRQQNCAWSSSHW